MKAATRLLELLNTVDDDSDDNELLRQALIAEADAVNLYVQLARRADKETTRRLLIDLADEERVHIGEIQRVLGTVDSDQKKANSEADSEVEEKKLV
jgi:rubrerythrin